MKTLLLVLAICGQVALADNDVVPLGASKGSVSDKSVIQANPPNTEAGIPVGTKPQTQEGQPPQPYIASIDSYGCPKVTELNMKETLGADLQTWLSKGLKGDPAAQALEKKLSEKMKSKFDLALGEWSIIQYFEPEDLAIHVTFDCVEKKDVAKRMPFAAAPTGEYKDPEGLIKSWDEYEDLALDLVESGQLEPESEECIAFHCPFGHKHAQLKKYEKIFVDGVKKHEAELVQILNNDKRADYRASAAYLLAYAKDGKKVVDAMVGRIHDPDATVRNNALRVLGDIAEFHPSLVIPHKPILEALNFPRVSDRSKALYVLYLLSLNSAQVRDEVLKTTVPQLISMMTAKQPDHQEISHAILRKLSGKEFPANDLRAWNNWYTHVQKDRGVATKK